MKNIAKITACLVLLAAFTSDSFGTTFTNEFWISTNTLSGRLGLGTLADPLDGSSASTFDSNMLWMPTNSTVHILAGTYQTSGWNLSGWQMQHGEHIIGSGIDVTTIHLARTNEGTVAISTPWEIAPQKCELSDLTVDLAGTINAYGVLLTGENNAIRRVKVINVYSTASNKELFMLGIGNGIVEDCEVTNFTGGACSAIPVFFGDYTVIRNNRIFLQNQVTQPTLGAEFAINIVASRNVLIEGNYVNYAWVGVYSDSGANTNLIIANNTFANCDAAVGLNNNPQQNVTFCFNTIKSPNEPRDESAFLFKTNISYTNVVIAGNTFTFDSTNGFNYYLIAAAVDFSTNLIAASTINGLTVVNNTIDSRYSMPSNGLTGCTAVNVYNNTDLVGNPSTIFNEVIPPNGITRKSITANYAATYSDRYIGLRNIPLTVTLPTAVGYAGKEYIVVNETGSSGSLGISVTSPNLIDGISPSTGYLLGGHSGKTIISDGTNWFSR